MRTHPRRSHLPRADSRRPQITHLAIAVVLVSIAVIGTILAPTVLIPLPTAEAAAEPTWVRCGGPLGGLGYDVRMRPDDPDRMLVTDAFAGVFASDDGGATWQPSNTGITVRTGNSGDAIPVFCVTIDPHDPDIVWAGTQYLRGIFRSHDGGATWTQMNNGVTETEGISFRGFTVDPRSSDIVYAAAELSSWQWNDGVEKKGREFDLTKGVVYKTVDGGKNWTAVWRGDNLARYILIDPTDPDVLYVSTGIFDREAANSDPTDGAKATPGGEGVVKSTDGGETWRNVNDGLENLYVGTLFMHPENPKILLAGSANNQYYQGVGVYLTTDGGELWQRTLTEGATSVEFSVSDPHIAYAASTSGIYRSQDGGHSWDWVTGRDAGWGPPGVLAGFPIDLQVDPRDPDRVFANNYGGGNFLSVDGGRTWTVASTGYTGAQARDIAVDPDSAGRVLVAARSGAFVTFDGGAVWQGLSTWPVWNIEWNAVAIDPSDPEHVLGGDNLCGRIAESHDGGRSWVTRGSPNGHGFAYRAFAFAPSDSDTVYAGTGAFSSGGSFNPELAAKGVFVSHDGGVTWASANDADSSAAQITMLAVHPSDPRTVYASTTQDGVLRTSDGGVSWQPLGGLPAGALFGSVAVSPHDPDIVYVGTFAGLYRSSDAGASWAQVMQGFAPESIITDIALDPTDAQVVYVSDVSSGVYRSQNGGSVWTPLNQGLRTRAVNRLALSSDGRHLYAATEGEGVFRLDLTGTPPPTATQPRVFADLPDDYPYSTAILGLSAREVIIGFTQPTGTPLFKPNDLVTRQQFAKMIVKSLNLTVTGSEINPFVDVVAQTGTDPFYPSKYVAVCALAGITRGKTSTTFAPYDNITRAQVMTMVVRAATAQAGVPLRDPPDEYFDVGRLAGFIDPDHGQNAHLAECNGLLDGIELGEWNPLAPATRGEVSQMLWNLYRIRESGQ